METVTLPAHWASALVNGDFSGLDDPLDLAHCERAIERLAAAGLEVVDALEDTERFTWFYALYDPESGAQGGIVCDYLCALA